MLEETSKLSEEEQKKQAEEQEKLILEANKKIEAAKKGEVQKHTQQVKQQQVQTDPTGHWTKVKKPRFEIELYEEETFEETGEFKGWRKVPSDKPIIIEAASKADLDEHARRFAFCHQRMQIVRKLDDQPTQVFPQQASQQVPKQIPETFEQQPQQVVQVQQVTQKQKPKFYKIGDIEIKDDNGKIYQKQWMKLSEVETQNFRIINDKTNALVNLNGKHLEMKKWVLVENSEDETTSLEESLND